MKIEKYNLWDNVPGSFDVVPDFTAYIPNEKKSDCAIVIFPGGAYGMLCDYEGGDYAKFFADNGITAFVVNYRVAPNKFPLPLLDARRGVRFVRRNAEMFGINKNKVAVMGSSAGGHLAAMTSTYYKEIDFEGMDDIDNEDFIPNAQILCYPVSRLLGKDVAHLGSGGNLLGENHATMGEDLSPDLIASEKTPVAFIWHTSNDQIVDVRNSLYYSASLHQAGVLNECHIFPNGPHGMALSLDDDHVGQWKGLLLNWLKQIGF